MKQMRGSCFGTGYHSVCKVFARLLISVFYQLDSAFKFANSNLLRHFSKLKMKNDANANFLQVSIGMLKKHLNAKLFFFNMISSYVGKQLQEMQ